MCLATCTRGAGRGDRQNLAGSTATQSALANSAPCPPLIGRAPPTTAPPPLRVLLLPPGLHKALHLRRRRQEREPRARISIITRAPRLLMLTCALACARIPLRDADRGAARAPRPKPPLLIIIRVACLPCRAPTPSCVLARSFCRLCCYACCRANLFTAILDTVALLRRGTRRAAGLRLCMTRRVSALARPKCICGWQCCLARTRRASGWKARAQK